METPSFHPIPHSLPPAGPQFSTLSATLSAQSDAEALRIKVGSIVMLLMIGGCLFYIASYLVTGKLALIPYISVPFLFPALVFYVRLKRKRDYATLVGFLIYLFTMLGLFKLTTTPGYLVDFFLMPVYVGISFLMLKYRHALMIVAYLLALYATASAIVVWFQPLPILYTNDNTSSIAVAFMISMIASVLIFYVFSRSYQHNSEKLSDALLALNKVNDDNKLLINVVSHDFQNYLVRVLLLVDSYKKDNAGNATHVQELENVEAAMFQLSNLISDIQVVRDLPADKTLRGTTLLPFDEILTKLNLLFRNQMLEKELVFNREGLHAARLHVNPEIFIHIILANLIGNAIKFSPPQNQIALGLDESAGTQVLTIANQASTEHLGNLRELAQGHDAPASAPGSFMEKGQGLGIGIVRKFCEVYGIGYSLSVALLPEGQLCRVTSTLTFSPA